MRLGYSTVQWKDDNDHVWTIRLNTAITADGSSHEILTSDPRFPKPGWSSDATGIYYGNPLFTDSSGIQYTAPASGYPVGNVIDSNGNEITYGSNGWTDTLGRVIPGYPTNSIAPGPGVTSSTTNCPSGTVSALQWNVPVTNGTTVPYKFCYANFSYQTNFGLYGINEASGTQSLINAIVLPNLTTWVFNYDSYLDIASVTLPTRGSISYTWTTRNVYPPSRIVASRTANAADGTGPHTWNYAWNDSTGQVIVTDPLLNDTVVTAASGYVTQTQSYSGSHSSGTLLKTVSTQYHMEVDPMYNYMTANAYVNVVPLSQTVSWPNGQTMQTTTTYDPGFQYGIYNFDTTMSYYNAYYGLPVTQTASDYGQGSAGSTLKQTNTVYYWQNNSSYKTANLLNLPQTVKVLDGSGNTCAETDYTYDNASYLTASGITTQHISVSGPRGNVSSVTQQLTNTPCTASPSWQPITSYANIYDTGTTYKSIDPLQNTTTYSYSSSFAGAYPTTVNNALNQSTTNNFDFNTGLLTSTTDPNLLQTSFSFDNMFRLSQVNHPDGGQDTITHQESIFPFTATLTSKINSSQNKLQTNVFDGLGRVTQSQLTSDPQGTIYTDTSYDVLGRVSTVSNPHRSGSAPTDGTTTYVFDPLNRTCVVIPPDGTAVSGSTCPATQPTNDLFTTYSGNTTTVTDQAAKSRRSVSDGLGRLTQVFEDPANANYETDYAYDPLGNLLTVNQKGGSANSANWRTRTFAYNSLSQLLCAANPEIQIATCPSPDNGTYTAGTIRYSYDSDGNLLTKKSPKPNQTSASVTVTATYGYDALNRVTSKSFDNGDPTINYAFDGVVPTGWPTGCAPGSFSFGKPVGKRTAMCDAAGMELWGYSITSGVGWMTTDLRTTNSVAKTTTYQNNFGGGSTTLTYPSGRVITYTPDGAGRMSKAVDVPNSTNYLTGTCANGTDNLGVCYTPPGSPSSLINGANLVSTFYYNPRLQPCRISVKNSATAPASCTDTATGNVVDFSYNFSLGSSDNGNVAGITNNRDTTRSQSFSYDSLNRIYVAETTSTYATSPSHCWGEQFAYDPWGNLSAINGASSAYTGCTQEALSVTPAINNQISGFCYDAAGNLLAQSAPPCPSLTYTYNAENQMTSTAGVTYTYDGDGKRVQKSSGKLYWHGMGSDPLDETDLTGSTTNSGFKEYIFFGGQRIASRDSSNNVNYYFSDHLGTARIVASSSGTILDDSDFFPFGGERVVASSSGNRYKFTGKERDSESGLDNFGKRYFGSTMGRFMQPDPLLNSGQPWNPQSWNRYAYTENNPLRYTDPTGLYKFGDCSGTAEQCLAQEQRFRDSIAKAKEALKGLDPKSKEAKALQKTLNKLGDEDEGNIKINFGDAGKTDGQPNLGRTAGNSITINYDAVDSTAKAADLNASEAAALDAGVTTHEGTHAFGSGLFGFMQGHFEHPAYYTESVTYQGLHNTDKAFSLWNESWLTVDKDKLSIETHRENAIQNAIHPPKQQQKQENPQ